MVFILASLLQDGPQQDVQRLGQEFMCEEWAWEDQLLEGNF